MACLAHTVKVNDKDPLELRLQSQLHVLLLGSNAPSTFRQYAGPWRKFVHWCHDLLVPRVPLPASPETVALYIASLHACCMEKGLSAAPIHTACSAIFAAHQLAGLESPTTAVVVKRARQGSDQVLGAMVKNRKEPLSPDMLLLLAQRFAAAGSPPVQVMLVALMVLCFAGGFRFSDVVRLRVRCFSFLPGMVKVFVPKKKNDQLREADSFPIAAGSSAACPVKLLQRVIGDSKLSPVDFVFRRFNGFRAEAVGYVCPFLPEQCLPYQQARYHCMKLLAVACGLDPATCIQVFGTHSGRSGMTSTALEAGVPKELIVQHVGWRSEKSINAYLQRDLATRLSVSQALGL